MEFVLKNYQAAVVKEVGDAIERSHVTGHLKRLASSPGNEKLLDLTKIKHGTQIKAPTGSGKTVILGHVIKDHLQDFVVLVFSPGKGGLEKQTLRKLNEITGKASLLEKSTLGSPPITGHTYVASWESLVGIKAGTSDYINILTRESEDGNVFQWMSQLHSRKVPVAIVIDESHHGKGSDTNSINLFLKNLVKALGYSPYFIEVSATPIGEGDSSYTIVNTPMKDVIASGLVRKTIRRNDGAVEKVDKMTADERSDRDVESALFGAALDKLNEIDKEYAKVKSKYHGLMAIQVPNQEAGREAMLRIEKYFHSKNITAENGLLSIYVDGDRRGGDFSTIHHSFSKVRVLVYKQAISTGWDCPRAQIFVGLRHLTSDIFATQNIGRFIRTTEAKHYDNDILDSTYVYSNIDDDLGAGNHGEDFSGEIVIPRESEVIRVRRKDGNRYALASLDDKLLSPEILMRSNNSLLNHALVREMWFRGAMESELGKNLSWVDVSEAKESIREYEVDMAGFTIGESHSPILSSSEKIWIGAPARWAQLERKILELVSSVQRSNHDVHVSTARFLRSVITRWMVEALQMPPGQASKSIHRGVAWDLGRRYANLSKNEPVDVHVFATELILCEDNFKLIAHVIKNILDDRRVKPIDIEALDGDGPTLLGAREVQVRDAPYSMPPTLMVHHHPDYQVDQEFVSMYAYTIKKHKGNGGYEEVAYKQEKRSSRPERMFEEFITQHAALGYGITLEHYVKNGVSRAKSLCFPVRGNGMEANFFPDYILEYKKSVDHKHPDYLPAIFEVKDENFSRHVDSLTTHKAKVLIEVSRKNRMPAGVVVPCTNNSGKLVTFRVVIGFSKDGEPLTTDLDRHYINSFLM